MGSAPLEVLLERDGLTTERLSQSETRAKYAREYVEETFNTLSNEPQEVFDAIFDSSKRAVEQEIRYIKDYLKI